MLDEVLGEVVLRAGDAKPGKRMVPAALPEGVLQTPQVEITVEGTVKIPVEITAEITVETTDEIPG